MSSEYQELEPGRHDGCALRPLADDVDHAQNCLGLWLLRRKVSYS